MLVNDSVLEDVPPALGAAVGEVLGLVQRAAQVDAARTMPTDRSAVASILGQPGSGKSTVLDFAVRALAVDGTVVLAPISPERFAYGDTLFGWVLAGLGRALADEHKDVSDATFSGLEPQRTVAEQLELLRRQEALSRPHGGIVPPAAGGSADQLAISLAAITTAGFNLSVGWGHLLDELERHGVRQVVIAVDDADQNADALTSILRDLRWLTSHHAVVVILAANESALLDHLATANQHASAGASDTSARRAADATMTKALPRHLRFALPELDRRGRLEFSPVHETETIGQLLDRCTFPSEAPCGISSLRDYFVVHFGDDEEISDYAEMLPANPRRLAQLWHSLRWLEQDESDRARRIVQVARKLLEAATAEASAYDHRVPPNTVHIWESGGELFVQLDMTGLVGGVATGLGRALFRRGQVSVSIRSREAFTIQPYVEDADADAVDPLPGSFTSALHFASDLLPLDRIPVPLLRFTGQRGTLSFPGGMNWVGTVGVEWGGRPVEQPYLVIPMWENFVDYFVYATAWNSAVNAAMDLAFEHPEPALAATVFLHLLLVIEVQDCRAFNGSTVPRTHDEWRRLVETAASDDAWDFLLERAQALYRPTSTQQRDVDFVTWIETLVLRSADPILVHTELQERVLRFRDSVVASGDRTEQARDRAAAFLESCAAHDLQAPWTPLTLSVLERYDPERAANLRRVHELAKNERSEHAQMLADTLEARGVPRELIGQMSVGGMTPEIASQLYALGFASQAVSQVAQAFPLPDAGAAADVLGHDGE